MISAALDQGWQSGPRALWVLQAAVSAPEATNKSWQPEVAVSAVRLVVLLVVPDPRPHPVGWYLAQAHGHVHPPGTTCVPAGTCAPLLEVICIPRRRPDSIVRSFTLRVDDARRAQCSDRSRRARSSLTDGLPCYLAVPGRTWRSLLRLQSTRATSLCPGSHRLSGRRPCPPLFFSSSSSSFSSTLMQALYGTDTPPPFDNDGSESPPRHDVQAPLALIFMRSIGAPRPQPLHDALPAQPCSEGPNAAVFRLLHPLRGVVYLPCASWAPGGLCVYDRYMHGYKAPPAERVSGLEPHGMADG